MKKVFIIVALLAFVFSFAGCGGGSGSMDSPKGENPGKSTLVELTPSHFVSHTNSDITLHAKVLDGNGNPVKNKPVRFTNLSPIGTLDKITDNTNAAGIATVTLHAHEVGFATVQAEVNEGLNQVRDRRTVFFTSASLTLQPYMTLDVEGAGDPFVLFETAGDNEVVIRATVFNSYGQRVFGSSVTFGADSPYRVGAATLCSDGTDSCEVSFPFGNVVTTDANGEAPVFVRVDPITIRDIQTVLNITALADNGAANMVSLFLQPVTVASVNVSANPAILQPGETSDITASVILNSGDPAPDGTTISFLTTCGAIDPFAQTTGGVATVTFTAPETVGACTVTATSGGVTGTADLVVTTALAVIPTSQTLTNPVAGDTAAYTVFGGIAPYNALSSHPGLVSASVAGDIVTATVDAVPVADTTVTITIIDSANNTVTATLILDVPAPLTLSPTSATITTPAPGATQNFTIAGGIPPYINPTSSDLCVTVGVSGTTLTATIGACAPPVTITISVQDSATPAQNASATLTLQP